jgi:hypothetical protein
MRVRPQRIRIERSGGPGGVVLHAEIDPARMPPDVAAAVSRLLDETRPPAPPGAPEGHDETYEVVLDYGDRQERLRYDAAELPGDVREVLDSLVGAAGNAGS